MNQEKTPLIKLSQLMKRTNNWRRAWKKKNELQYLEDNQMMTQELLY